MPGYLGVSRKQACSLLPFTQGVPGRLSKPPLGRTMHPWALISHKNVFGFVPSLLLWWQESHPVLGWGRRRGTTLQTAQFRRVGETEEARCTAPAMMVGVYVGWAPRKPFINRSFHSMLLFIATLAPTSGSPALAFPSSSLYPWTVESSPPVMHPSNTACWGFNFTTKTQSQTLE
jgi:hypothetical protein